MEQLKKAAKTGDRGKGIAGSSSIAPPSKPVALPPGRTVAAPLSRVVAAPRAGLLRLRQLRLSVTQAGPRHVPGLQGRIIGGGRTGLSPRDPPTIVVRRTQGLATKSHRHSGSNRPSERPRYTRCSSRNFTINYQLGWLSRPSVPTPSKPLANTPIS